MKKTFAFLILFAALAAPAAAQQKIAYVDSEYIFSRTPEFATVQQQVDRLAQEWQREIEQKQRDTDELFQEYQARELLYTQEERRRKRDEIVRAEEEVDRLRRQYFGPDGELFRQQEQLLRPLQERVLAAIEEVATADGYDYVFDKSGDVLFLFAREQLDLSDRVLEELGIEIESTGRGSSR
ncbi:MAG: OmpH family outer membrane protein [Rhodothermales bacterium]|nr:OmpH family outer membrane protein [Rhodothermales bacterium]